MINLTQKELININGGDNSAGFYAGRQFAEDIESAGNAVIGFLSSIGGFFKYSLL